MINYLAFVMPSESRTGLVTGGDRGLGFETCRHLAQLGLSVILSARDITKGEKAAKQLIDRGLDVLFYHLDVSDHSHIDLEPKTPVHCPCRSLR
jgi:NAD(P)-dependent dehydrogenase (short-subunit alcohol dehydrogenase family)